MKRYVKDLITFDIDAIIVIPEEISADTDPSDFNIPSGEVISDLKEVSPQMVADYDAFVESIEDLLIDYYGFELTYYNDSDDNSRYYNFLARDSEGNIKAKFRLRLRISNHDPKRSKESQSYKREEKKSPELKKFIVEKPANKLRPYVKMIIVNNKEYESYEEAFVYIDNKIEK